MCLSPSFVWVRRGPGWQKIPVPCKRCRHCKWQYVNDYVGRSLCEASTAKAVTTLTLTYRDRTDLAEQVITPSHFQDCVRSLRRRGHKLRYFVAGEHGELKGRVHYHALIFWQDQPPYDEIPQGVRFWADWWPHGHILADWNGDEAAVRYVAKYLWKEQSGQRWFSLSKKPVLGWCWFRDKAEMLADLDVFPRGFDYMPPGGKPGRRYIMTGATRRDYLAYLVDLHSERNGIDKHTLSEWAALSLDKVFRWQFKRECALPSDARFYESFGDEIERRRPSVSSIIWMLYQTDPANYDEPWQNGGFSQWLVKSVTETLEPKRHPRRGRMSDLSLALAAPPSMLPAPSMP